MRKKLCLNAICLLMSAIFLTACGSTGNNQSDSSTSPGMEQSAGAKDSEGKNDPKDETGAGQLMWQDKKGEWQFDTSQFDASKFNGKLYIDGKEIALPMTVNSLLEQEIYTWLSVNYTLEGTLTDMQEKEMKSEDFNHEDHVWHNVDGSLRGIDGIDQCSIWNPLKNDVLLKDCAIGSMMFTSNEKGVPIMGFEEPKETPYRLSLKEVVDKFGAPCYYTNGSFTSTVYYYYGDYSFYFNFFSSSGDIATCTYVTTAFGEGPLWLDTEGWAEYKEVYDRINP